MSVSNAVDAAPIPDAGQVLALDEFHCPTCGYSLRGLISDRCPECGESLTPLRSVESAIPWVNRARIGWVRGFFGTIWFAIFQQKRFAREIVRPASPRDAARFRRTVLLFVAIGEILVAGLLYPLGPGDLREMLGSAAIALILGAISFVLLPFAVVAKSRHAFLEMKLTEQRQRARAASLSDYACGGLLLLPAVQLVTLGALVAAGAPYEPDDLLTWFLVISGVTLLALIVGQWLVLTSLAGKWLHSRSATTVFGLLLAGSWALTLLLLVVSAATVGFFVWVGFVSGI